MLSTRDNRLVSDFPEIDTCLESMDSSRLIVVLNEIERCPDSGKRSERCPDSGNPQDATAKEKESTERILKKGPFKNHQLLELELERLQ